MITEIKGDITKVKCDYICQQNNCIAVKPHGLSLTIARKFLYHLLFILEYGADGTEFLLLLLEDRPPWCVFTAMSPC